MREQCSCGLNRVKCKKCGGFFDLYSRAWHSQKTCPFCGSYNYFTIVPDWYGRPIPGWLEIIWGEGGKKDSVFIPEYYLEVRIYLAGQKGQSITIAEALAYFERRAQGEWKRRVEVMPNHLWREKRSVDGNI
jgi:hypothetical protein